MVRQEQVHHLLFLYNCYQKFPSMGYWSKKLFIIILAIVMNKEKEPYILESRLINNKQFLVPVFNLYDTEKYMLPKLDLAPVHHTFYQQNDIEQVYKQMEVDPNQLNHNLDKVLLPDKPVFKKSEKSQAQQSSVDNVSSSDVNESSSNILNITQKPRPPLREKGFTHFIHIPLWDSLKDVYQNQIVPRIEEEDRDLLQPLSSMHMTVMVFRLRKLEDLPLWSQVLKSAKRPKVSIKGVNIFPIKKNYARVLFLNIKGAEDLIDRVVSKAVELQLVSQSELSHIKFDKISGTYKAETHITLLKTKGDDLFDFTEYLKSLNKISVSKPAVSEIRLSMIGTHDGQDYFNEECLPL